MLQVIEMKEGDFKRQLTKEQEELGAVNAKVCRLMEKEASLASQNTKQSTELVANEKKQQWLHDELSRVKNELKLRETELNFVCEGSKSTQEKYTAEIKGLRKAGVEQSKIVKEYQEKVLLSTCC